MIVLTRLFILAYILDLVTGDDKTDLVSACIKDTGISPSKWDLMLMSDNSPPYTKRGQCVMACMMKRKNMMMQNGRFNPQIIDLLEKQEQREDVGKYYDELRQCTFKIPVSTDECLTAARIAQCFTEITQQFEVNYPLRGKRDVWVSPIETETKGFAAQMRNTPKTESKGKKRKTEKRGKKRKTGKRGKKPRINRRRGTSTQNSRDVPFLVSTTTESYINRVV